MKEPPIKPTRRVEVLRENIWGDVPNLLHVKKGERLRVHPDGPDDPLGRVFEGIATCDGFVNAEGQGAIKANET